MWDSDEFCHCSLGGPAFAARAAAAANAVAAADAAGCGNGRNASSSDVNSSFGTASSVVTPDDTVHDSNAAPRTASEENRAAATLFVAGNCM